MDEVETARRCHLSIPNALVGSRILLHATHSHHEPILHNLEISRITPANPEAVSRLESMIAEHEGKAYEPDSMSNVALSYLREQLRRAWIGIEDEQHQWYRVRHHELLQSMLAQGFVPSAWLENVENPGTSEPQTLAAAYKEALSIGFAIPERFLEDGNQTSYGEKEAYYAATEFAANRCVFDLSEEDSLKLRDVMQLSSSFLIPNITPGAPPFVADQLWIVKGPEKTVRFLILEIDGEFHLEPHNQERDRQRDAYFNQLGYEVYRVAGWWARIDPFRVIGEFLSVALGMKSFKSAFLFAPDSINDYRCFACGKPMVRWDDGWIAADYKHLHDDTLDGYDNGYVFVHRQCQREC